MAQGIVMAMVVDPKTGQFKDTTNTFNMIAEGGNPIKTAERLTREFASGMRTWAQDRKDFGQGVLAKGLTLKFVPIIV